MNENKPSTALGAAARIERKKAIAALRVGLADASAGRRKPARVALGDLAKKYGIRVARP
jgi:hypothetical protein